MSADDSVSKPRDQQPKVPAAEPRGSLDEQQVIFDWNVHGAEAPMPGTVELLDETLRDGIQSPSVQDPNINDKLILLRLMAELGIQTASLGLPGAGPRAYMDVLDLVMEIERSALPILPAAAARTVEADIKPILEISDKTGLMIEVMAFIGSSPIRHYVEAWDLPRMTRAVEQAVAQATAQGLPVTFVTEDTTRSDPDTLETLFKAAMGAGARRLCLCDTVGHATPNGTTSLVRFTRELIEREGLSGQVAIDWHGHNDRGLGITNTIFAIEAGANRVHGTALGTGERVGNTSMELILLNLKLLGLFPEQDVSKLSEYSMTAAHCMRHAIPRNYPIVGRDAFRTATGVHAAAIGKAKRKGDDWLADRIYSGVPAGMFGRHQEIEIAHTSGAANVEAWFEAHDIPLDEALIAHVLKVAKRGTRVLEEEEIRIAIADYTLGGS